MIKNGIINKKGVRKEFNNGFAKIGNNILEFLIKIKEEEIKQDIEKNSEECQAFEQKSYKKRGYLVQLIIEIILKSEIQIQTEMLKY